MRYMININPRGAQALFGSIPVGPNDDIRAEFRTPKRGLASGAIAQVRLVESTVGHPFRPRDSIGNRYRTTLNADTARTLGLKGKRRYELREAGTSGWFWLVPHSQVGKGRKIGGPGLTVSIYDK